MDPVKLIRALLATLKRAIQANREDDQLIRDIRAENDEEVGTLKTQLAEANREKAEIDALASEIDEVLDLAIASNLPAEAIVEAIRDIRRNPSDLIREGKAPALEHIPDSRDLRQPDEPLTEEQQARQKELQEKEAADRAAREKAEKAEANK